MPILGREPTIRLGCQGIMHIGRIQWGHLPSVLTASLITNNNNLSEYHRNGEVFTLVDFRPRIHAAILMFGGNHLNTREDTSFDIIHTLLRMAKILITFRIKPFFHPNYFKI